MAEITSRKGKDENAHKKAFLLSAFIVSILILLSYFFPVFAYSDAEGYAQYVGLFGYFSHTNVYGYIFLPLSFLVCLFGSFLFLYSYLWKDPNEGDKADKRFILGSVVYIVGHVILGISAALLNSFIAMAISILAILIYVLYVFLHFKYFTYY